MVGIPPLKNGNASLRVDVFAEMFQRRIGDRLNVARQDTPVVLLTGARQVGKSTLARAAAATPSDRTLALSSSSVDSSRYITLDDANVRSAAQSDSQAFIEGFRDAEWTVIDEVQRVPELLVAIKREVDLDRRPGRFVLTGSSDVLAVPRVADSLAGRIELLRVWPLAECEIEGTDSRFLSNVFAARFPRLRFEATGQSVLARALAGGYPEVQTRKNGRRDAWFGNYLATVVAREIVALSAIEDSSAIVRLLRALASRSGGPRNFQTLSNDTKIPTSTLTRYVALLEATFLISQLPAWSNNLDARIMKSPKILLNDSGLFAYLLGLRDRDAAMGFTVETFVGSELAKLASWAGDGPEIMHFRDQRGNEVDFVLEHRDRRIVGIEVKTSRTVSAVDFRGLDKLSELAGDLFVRGVVLYAGSETLSFGPRRVAVPIEALWRDR